MRNTPLGSSTLVVLVMRTTQREQETRKGKNAVQKNFCGQCGQRKSVAALGTDEVWFFTTMPHFWDFSKLSISIIWHVVSSYFAPVTDELLIATVMANKMYNGHWSEERKR